MSGAREQVEAAVRDYVRTSGVDPIRDGGFFEKIIDDAISDYE